MRRLAAFCLVAALAIAACGGSSGTQAPGGGGGGNTTAPPGGGGGNWSGNGSAKVTIGGTEVTISPGGCLDGGSRGVDFRFGDWANAATADYIMGLVYHDGHTPVTVSGRVGGKPFVLGNDGTGTISGDSGTFAGTDSLGGNGAMSATFSCK